MIDQKIEQLGQEYFKQGVILVGSQEYANKITDGTDDQVQVQAALDEAFASTNVKEVRIVDNLSFNANASYNESIGGSTRRLGCRLRDGVKLTIAAGCTVSFASGGNAAGDELFAFGNYGDLTGASVICEGVNGFDGLSTIAGTVGTRTGAVSFDGRSNNATDISDNVLVIAGEKTAGALVDVYGYDGASAIIARDNQITVTYANNCLSALLVEQTEESSFDVKQALSTTGNAVDITNGVINSSLKVGLVRNATGYGVSFSTTGTLNSLDVEINEVTECSDHNIFVQGLNGSLSAHTTRSQKSGLHFDNTVTLDKLSVTHLYSVDNNQSSSTWSGVSGIAKNVTFVAFNCSDYQNTQTQYRGIDMTDPAVDYITLVSGKAENNTNDQIVINGINSRVESSVIPFDRTREIAASGSYTITGLETVYKLNAGSTLTLPDSNDLDSTLAYEYDMFCVSGTAAIAPESTDEIGDRGAGNSLSISDGQSVRIVWVDTKWEVLGDVGSAVTSIGSLDSATTTINTDVLYYEVDVDADFSASIPESSTWIGKTMVFQIISANFNEFTLNRSGSDVIQKYGVVANPATATSIKVGVPNTIIKLTSTQTGVIRSQVIYDLSLLQEIAYKVTPNQTISGVSPQTAVLQLNTLFKNSINAIDSNFGFDIATYEFTSPCDMTWAIEYKARIATTSATLQYADLNLEVNRGSGYVSVDYAPMQSVINTDIGSRVSRSYTLLDLNKGEKVRVLARGFSTGTVSLTLESEAAVSTEHPDLAAIIKINAHQPL